MRDIATLLPGYNCGECGLRRCRDFALALIEGDIELLGCPYMDKERFVRNIGKIKEILAGRENRLGDPPVIIGVIDGHVADFTLAPLPGEPSCREDLCPFDPEGKPAAGEYIKYRPLGCPVTHFAKVLDLKKGLLRVHISGPLHRLGLNKVVFRDIGICMVAAFEGIINKGRVPDVGRTVRFVPEHCMMRKVHSGVVVHSEGKCVRIEGIDLKVW